MQAINIGDAVTFKASCDFRKFTRKVNGFDSIGRPTVRHRGYDRFILLPRDIIAIEQPDSRPASS